MSNEIKNTLISEKRNSGYTFIEMLVYISIFTVVIGVVFNMMLYVYEMNRKINSYSNVSADAYSAMERIAYEVTNSKYFYLPTSNFLNYNHDAAKNGQLSIATERYATANDSLTFMDFYVEGGTLFLKKDGLNLPVPLTSSNVSVSGFDLDYFKNGKRESVRINLTMSSVTEPAISINLFDTVTIR